MSLDIILWAPSKSALATWAKTHPAANPLLQDDGEGNTVPRDGISYCWWAGSGQFMTAKGTYDAEGVELTPPTFAPGVVVLMKLHTTFFESDKEGDGQRYDIDQDGNTVPREQWQYSKVAKWVKNNGVPGTMGTVNYYEVDGIRLFKPSDVETFLAANDLPGHGWVDGNSY
jgi:hypothetical protein